MEINYSDPWIHLGFEDIFVRYGGQYRWEMLSQDDASWAASVVVHGGREFLRSPGLKLGFNQLDSLVLSQLLELVGDNAVLFAPPRQLHGLQLAAKNMDSPPSAISLDSRLMVNVEPINMGHSKADFYVFNWNDPTLGIPRGIVESEQDFIFDVCPLPVLMTTTAYVNQQVEILNYYQGDSGIGAASAELDFPQQSSQEARQVGFGLVWAWGFGVNMWQWALKPIPLQSQANILEFEPPNICRIRSDNEEHKFKLLEPLMECKI